MMGQSSSSGMSRLFLIITEWLPEASHHTFMPPSAARVAERNSSFTKEEKSSSRTSE